jgi:hypothetical protein
MVRLRGVCVHRVALVALIGVVLLAYASWRVAIGTVFPPPWNDEIHFLVPASPWLSGRTFAADGMLSPGGIYWIPSGYYVFMATVFSWLPTSLAVARWVSTVLIAACAWLVARMYGTTIASAGKLQQCLLGALYLVATPCVIASSVARPEALALFLGLIALRFYQLGRPAVVLAAGVAALSVHPLLALPAISVAWLALFEHPWRAITRSETTLILLALALVCVECSRLALHFDSYASDWAF